MLRGTLASKSYDSYIGFWDTVDSVTCTGYQADPASLTVSTHCIYDVPRDPEGPKIIEQDLQITLVKEGSEYYLASSSTSNTVETPA